MAQGLGSDKPDYRKFSGYEGEKDGESGPESPELKAPLTQYKAEPWSCFIFSFRTKQKGISNVSAKGRKLSKSTTGRIRQPSESLPLGWHPGWRRGNPSTLERGQQSWGVVGGGRATR